MHRQRKSSGFSLFVDSKMIETSSEKSIKSNMYLYNNTKNKNKIKYHANIFKLPYITWHGKYCCRHNFYFTDFHLPAAICELFDLQTQTDNIMRQYEILMNKT